MPSEEERFMDLWNLAASIALLLLALLSALDGASPAMQQYL